MKPHSSVLRKACFGFAALALLAAGGCHKKTRSDFRLERYEYEPGQMIEITNLNPKRNQIWELVNPDGVVDTTCEAKNPQFVLDLLGKDGLYTVNLYDNKAEQKKGVKTSKNLLVKCELGSLQIEDNSWMGKNFYVYVDNQFVGYQEMEGIMVVDIPTGLRHVKIITKTESGAPGTVEETVTIVKDQTAYIYVH